MFVSPGCPHSTSGVQPCRFTAAELDTILVLDLFTLIMYASRIGVSAVLKVSLINYLKGAANALQMVAALAAGCGAFLTNDRVLPTVPGLRICN